MATSGTDAGDDRDAAAAAAARSSEEDPRYKKRSSGVHVLDDVSQSWSEVRDDANTDVDWILLGYVPGSRTDITTLSKGSGGIESCSSSLPPNQAIFGGCKLRSSGRFVTFFYVDGGTSVMARGRASMHKNGVLNALEGSDREIEMRRGMTEDDIGSAAPGSGGGARPCGDSIPQRLSPLSGPSRRHHPEGGGGGSAAPAGPVYRKAAPPAPSHDGGAVDGASSGEESSSTMTTGGAAQPSVVIPYSNLIDASALPPGIDPTHRERYLSGDEFERVFDGLDRRTFDALPAWKRTDLKKAKRLF